MSTQEELRAKLAEKGLFSKINITPIENSASINSFKPLPFSELKLIVPEEIKFIFIPCLPTSGIAFIYAATGVGNTLFSLNLSYAIAGGGEFLKYKCPEPRKVLYIDGEMSFVQLHSRIMQISEQQGKLDDESNFLLLTPDKVSPHRMPKIDEASGQAIYLEIIKTLNIEVIVFDNLSMLTSIDENKSNEWKIVQDFLLHLRALNKTSIVIHHAGKEKDGYRGTSRMLDCADVAISLQAINDDSGDNLNNKRFIVEYQKSRMFGGKDAEKYEANLLYNQWSFKSIHVTNLEKVVAGSKANMTQRDMASAFGLSQPTVHRLVQKAITEKLIQV